MFHVKHIFFVEKVNKSAVLYTNIVNPSPAIIARGPLSLRSRLAVLTFELRILLVLRK